MSRQGKSWGETAEFFRNALVSAHHITIKKGGFCSEHQHAHKYNLFYVISGKLLIEIWRENDRIDGTIITAGQSTAVSPGFFHKFTALLDTEAVEIYQVFLEDPDIDRRTVGGLKR